MLLQDCSVVQHLTFVNLMTVLLSKTQWALHTLFTLSKNTEVYTFFQCYETQTTSNKCFTTLSKEDKTSYFANW